MGPAVTSLPSDVDQMGPCPLTAVAEAAGAGKWIAPYGDLQFPTTRPQLPHARHGPAVRKPGPLWEELWDVARLKACQSSSDGLRAGQMAGTPNGI